MKKNILNIMIFACVSCFTTNIQAAIYTDVPTKGNREFKFVSNDKNAFKSGTIFTYDGSKYFIADQDYNAVRTWTSDNGAAVKYKIIGKDNGEQFLSPNTSNSDGGYLMRKDSDSSYVFDTSTPIMQKGHLFKISNPSTSTRTFTDLGKASTLGFGDEDVNNYKSYIAGTDITISDNNAISVSKMGKIIAGNTGIVTGDTVYKVTNALETSLASQQSMISSNTSTITNLQSTISSLKNSVANINSNVMSATKSISSSMSNRMQSDLGNLTEDGKAVIRDLIKETLKSSSLSASVGVDNAYTASPVSTYKAPLVQGETSSDTVTSKDIEDIHTELGNKVDKTDFSALKNTVSSNTDKIAKNTEAIGVNTAAIADLKENKANIDGSNIDVTKFTEKLGVGEIAKDNGGLVTGGTVYTALEQKADYDYVNAGFGAMQNQMDSMQHRLTQDINRVGAGAAALAGLHPQDYDPDNKLDFAAGYGHYKNANATALGIFYRPNAGTTVSLSGTIGNGDPMISAGLSFKLGMGKNVEKVMITKEKYDELQARDEQMEQRIKELEETLQSMKTK